MASSRISCCSLYENTIADLLLSSLSSDSNADFVELIFLFGTGDICVNESLMNLPMMLEVCRKHCWSVGMDVILSEGEGRMCSCSFL